MARVISHMDLRRIKIQHIGPILLGRFLEQGQLRLLLTADEERHLAEQGSDGMRRLHYLFCEAATKSGLAKELEDWNFVSSRDSREMYVYDPSRIKSTT